MLTNRKFESKIPTLAVKKTSAIVETKAWNEERIHTQRLPIKKSEPTPKVRRSRKDRKRKIEKTQTQTEDKEFKLQTQERGLAKIGNTPRKLTLTVENKPDSPVQSSHQGELKSTENNEEEKQFEEVVNTPPSAFSNFKDISDRFSSKAELKKIISQASQNDLALPRKKDMEIREYLKNHNEKGPMNMSRITNENTDISKINPLDSFQQDLTAVKPYLSQFDSIPLSPSKLDFQKEYEAFQCSEKSIEFNSPSKIPFEISQVEERPKMHKFRSSDLSGRSPRLSGKQRVEKAKNPKTDKYLLSLAKKFNPAYAKCQTKRISLVGDSTSRATRVGSNLKPKNNLRRSHSKKNSLQFTPIGQNSLVGRFKSPLRQGDHVYGEKSVDSKIQSIANKLKKKTGKYSKSQHPFL